jgi:hypothetical protein
MTYSISLVVNEETGKVSVTTHGRASTYNGGCRCGLCKAAHATQQRKYRAKRKTQQVPPGVTHGYSCYVNWSCRCQVCTQANRDTCRKHYHAQKAAK